MVAPSLRVGVSVRPVRRRMPLAGPGTVPQSRTQSETSRHCHVTVPAASDTGTSKSLSGTVLVTQTAVSGGSRGLSHGHVTVAAALQG